jgi:PAS domain S-box-containing protein
MPNVINPTVYRYGSAAGIVAAATLIRFALDPVSSDDTPFLTYFAAVVLVAWACGSGPTLFSLVLSAAAAAYFFLVPRHSFAVYRFSDQIALGIFTLLGLVAAGLSEQLDKARRRVQRKQRELEAEIDERRRAQAALSESSKVIRSFFDAAPLMMGVVDILDDDILHLSDNAATCKFFGLEPDALRDRSARASGVPQAHVEEWLRHYRASVATGRPVRFEYSHQTPHQLHWLSATVAFIETTPAGRPRCSYVVEDVTDRKHADEELRRSQLELQQRIDQLADADRRKNEFLATLAHELRNPLAPIRNGLQVLRLTDDPATAEHARDMMERQLGQMVRLIDDLLDVSRISRDKLELRKARIPLSAVVDNAVETAAPLIESKGHTLAVNLPPEPVYLDADLTRLAQVFWNLLNNSAKYTDPGGRIELTAAVAGPEVVVAVRDTGIGIPAEALPNLFTLFSQVDHSLERAEGGLGIGLALVKGLVAMHGGSVEARSDGPHRGSEFEVRLPLADGPLDDAKGRNGAPGDACRRRRILVVDDNRDGAASLGMMLSLVGHDTRTAHDGLEAYDLAEAFRPEVILPDIGLPKMNGYEACRRIRSAPWGKEMFIVAITGWGQDEDRRRSQQAGFDKHMVKPIDFAGLEVALAAIG